MSKKTNGNGLYIKVEVHSPNSLSHMNFKNAFEVVQHFLKHCTEEERLMLFSDYCRGCGTDRLPCHCENDE